MRLCCATNSKNPADIYLFKVNIENTRTMCEICSMLTIKTPEQCHGEVLLQPATLLKVTLFYDVVLMSLLLTFNRFHKLPCFNTLLWCSHCWLRTSKCWLGVDPIFEVPCLLKRLKLEISLEICFAKTKGRLFGCYLKS